MKIFHKILGITLPTALAALVMGSWLTYTLSDQAIQSMANRWLGTRLEEAMARVKKHEEFLRLYGITNIRAGTLKAQHDALEELKSLRIGEAGYIFVLDALGHPVHHPDIFHPGIQAPLPPDIPFQALLNAAQSGTESVRYTWKNKRHLAMTGFFKPWNWVVVATDPINEIYGSMNHAKKYLFFLALLSSVGVSLLIILLTRRLVAPLQLLVQGTRRVGRGDLDVNIPVKSSDEIGRLSTAFNTMSQNLKQSLADLHQSEKHFRSLTENSTDLIAVLNPRGTIQYISPSVSRFLGYRPSELTGKSFAWPMDAGSTRIFNRYISRINQASPDESVYQEVVFRTRDNQMRIFELSARNLIYKPEVQGIVVNSRNMTVRKKMETELKASELQLHRLSSRLISVQEDERKRLSVELHDEVGQSLTVMKLKVILMEENLGPGDESTRRDCEDMLAYIDQVIENVRRLCRDLTPPAIEDLGLQAAVLWLLEALQPHYDLNVDMDMGEAEDRLALDAQILVFRIFQESINNAVKHAGATALTVAGKIRDQRLHFSIQDNGAGFDTELTLADPSKNGLGLPAMRERVRMLGGKFRLDSRPGRGTILQFNLPLDTREGHE